MTDEFDELIAGSLQSRAGEVPAEIRGFHDVRRRVRRRRQRRVAVTMSPVFAGLVYMGAGSAGNGERQVGTSASTSLPDESSAPPNVSAASESASTVVPDSFPPLDPQAQNFLIAGSDANACVDATSPWAGAADPVRESRGSRSDTIMVLRVDPVLHEAAVLSFPRDLWVMIPGRGKGRLNSAYVENDYALLAQTIYDNFGVVVDHYIQLDFCAFKRIVDAIGGVDVPFATPIVDNTVGINIDAGCHTFNGDEALAYVRSRHLKWIDENGAAHEDPTSDLGRIARQQDFLRRTLQAALDAGLFDPSVARALIESLQTDIVTEAGFTVNDMLAFAGALRDVDPRGIHTYQIEAAGMVVSGNSVLEPLIDSDNMTAILGLFRGEASLAVAPEQEFAATPTSPATVTTSVGRSERSVGGQILPDPDVACS
jgi:LCP family protein required for cell wall assembly